MRCADRRYGMVVFITSEGKWARHPKLCASVRSVKVRCVILLPSFCVDRTHVQAVQVTRGWDQLLAPCFHVKNTYRYSLPNVGAALGSGGDRLNESCRFDWSDSQRRRLRAGRFCLLRLLLLRIDSRTSANPIVPCARAPLCR